ncbi:hypothetical protein [Sediminitomix flava]|uniref:Uncharacterized protein n=1 Tax=Sediminitomix flava TaxID=379075 RepID=A0A315Z8F3_SEDFL|nr:hypothetical protein [Sediminitomix flava]PWJ40938.1 hypothetical protein BC781_104204 [Sediminitomix flava]
MKSALIRLIKRVLSFFYFLFKYSKKVQIIEDERYNNIFFGYYDVTSFSSSENLLTIHGQKYGHKDVDILLYNLQDSSIEVIDSSMAWNYQQGTRLMWFSSDELLYNKYDEIKGYYSVIKNINDKSETIIPFPVQALYENSYILSIDYSNLTEIGTEYGYPHLHQTSYKDSLVYFNLKTSEYSTLFQVTDCVKALTTQFDNATKCHFNHFLISPNGNYFVFIFRFYCNGKRVDNLLGYSLITNKLDVIVEGQMVSHCVWRNNEEVLFWGRVDNCPGYFQINTEEKCINLKYSTEKDGHPSFINNDVILTDTYPDRFLCQTLSTINIETGEKNIKLEKKHPAKYSTANRCDMHPSLSPSKTFYQIDVIEKGKRKVCIGKV